MTAKAGLTFVVSLLAVCACDSARRYEKSWEAVHSGVLLPGYSDFKGEINGTDDGYVVFSYRLPTQIKAETAIEGLRAHIKERLPCYEAMEQTKLALTLRCPGGRERGGYRWDEEYRARLEPKQGRVYVLVIDSIRRSNYTEVAARLDSMLGTLQ